VSVLKEWLKNTYKVNKFGFQETRPRIVCKDGFSMSVQAGYYLYSIPRIDMKSGNYEAVEIGFPSEKEELICEYAEDSSDYTETVYPYVPIEIVEQVIKKHNGMVK
jgi:hypothetical protein